MLAHELLGAMFDHWPDELNGRLLGQASSLNALFGFWQNAHEDDPRLTHHPLKGFPNYKVECIPIGIHADGVPYKKGGPGASLKVTSWSSLLGTGENTWDTHYVWDCTPSGMGCKLNEHGVDSDEMRFQVMIWDFEVALSGKYPSTDPWGQTWPVDSLRARRAGQFIAGGYRLALLQLRADIMHLVAEYGFKHYSTEDCC